jgi:hypothetical protein
MRFLYILLFINVGVQAQTLLDNTYIETFVFRGNIYKHTDDVSHLITGHPEGVLISLNRKTLGEKEWESIYNYPDYGVSFQYQDFKNTHLGEAYAVALHYNFYFLKRNLVFRISQGIGMTTNPYDRETNHKNNAFGSRLLSSNLFLLQFKKENIIDQLGIQAGIVFTHFSNGRIKSPNSGINTYALNLGLNYNLDTEKPLIELAKDSVAKPFRENIKLNFVFRSGVSESSVVGMGQKPFYHFGVYADKRLGRKSAIQLGTDLFLSQYLKDYIEFSSVAFPNKPYLDPTTDYKRIGVFVGHELFINKLSIEAQLGYYVYKPFKYEIDVYQRVGMKYYLGSKVFTGVGLKTHGARAEAIEGTLGVRL